MVFGRLGSEKNNKKIAMKREREVAAELGGKAQPNSGAMDGMKGDIKLRDYLIDDKHTSNKSFILGTVDLNKITREALEQNLEPMLLIKFFKGISLGVDSEWIILPKRVGIEKGLFGEDIQ